MKTFRYEPAGGSLRYFDLPGIEPPLVFLHGLGAAAVPAFLEVANLPPLVERRRILIDLFGHGFSDRPAGYGYAIEHHADAVASLLASLDGSRFVLVGHSMGGSIAILVAVAIPRRVGRLILAEPNLDPGAGTVSGLITRFTESDFAARGHRELVKTVESAGFSVYATSLCHCDPTALYRSAVSLIAPRDPTYREILLRLTIPRTFLCGEQGGDVLELPRLADEGIGVAAVPNAGHDMMTDNPVGFAAAVAAGSDGDHNA